MSDDFPTYYPLLHKSKEYFIEHIQMFVPPKHCKSKVYHPDVVGNLSFDALYHNSSTAKASCYHLCSAFILKPMSSVNYIILVTCILRSSSPLNPLSLSLAIPFLDTLKLILMLRLLIIMLQLPNDFLR